MLDVDRDAEHPGPVRQRADDGLIAGVLAGERREALVRVDVVDQHDPAC
jgi:hypothetical protein